MARVAKNLQKSCHFLPFLESGENAASVNCVTYLRTDFFSKSGGARLRQADYSKRVAEFAMETQAGDVLFGRKIGETAAGSGRSWVGAWKQAFRRREMASVEEVNF